MGLLLGFGWFFPVLLMAQDTNNSEAPQILTTDLVRRQKSETSQLEVSFVIYDDDIISEVKINGIPKSFEPAHTLNIEETLFFTKGRNLITVEATDENGNLQTIHYLVAYGVELEQLGEDSSDEKSEFIWKIAGDIQYNTDTNPNNDLGVPIDTGDYNIEGQISDDEQTDTQTVVNLVGFVGYGKIKGFVGYTESSYSKALYESLASKVIALGASYAPNSNEDGLNAQYTLLDINIDSEAYGQYHVYKFGYQFGREDEEDGTTKHLWSLVYTQKLFASENLDPGNNQQIGWEYTNMDAEKLDFFKSILAFNSGSDGSEESKYSGYIFDFDWYNKWESGFMLDMGFGFQYKEYPNQEPLSEDLGDMRIDVPIRYSTGLGWAFNDDWSLGFTYLYKINVSTKSPYYKTVTGFQLKGGF
jgi:hypothetical protein